VISCHWIFADGTRAEWIRIEHAYAAAGDFEGEVTAMGLKRQLGKKATDVDGTIRLSSSRVSKRLTQPNALSNSI
jgi:hypothetical protein